MATFDGANRLIILDSDYLDVPTLYSDWKRWMSIGDNLKYLRAFITVGGEPIGAGKSITPYYFLDNGWRVRPMEAEHLLTVDGLLLTVENESAFIPTIGNYNVVIEKLVAVNAQTIEVNTGSGLTTEEKAQLLKASKALSTGQFIALN